MGANSARTFLAGVRDPARPDRVLANRLATFAGQGAISEGVGWALDDNQGKSVDAHSSEKPIHVGWTNKRGGRVGRRALAVRSPAHGSDGVVLMKAERVGLRGARSLYAEQFSGGMARRVVMAREANRFKMHT